mmetsp:Transcript_45335/g.119789  ORF Transcript_45335/g.119789 Transcript_45335/m.119789 type:complete len:269 (-) Transcript_45335:1136-1942(-)
MPIALHCSNAAFQISSPTPSPTSSEFLRSKFMQQAFPTFPDPPAILGCAMRAFASSTRSSSMMLEHRSRSVRSSIAGGKICMSFKMPSLVIPSNFQLSVLRHWSALMAAPILSHSSRPSSPGFFRRRTLSIICWANQACSLLFISSYPGCSTGASSFNACPAKRFRIRDRSSGTIVSAEHTSMSRPSATTLRGNSSSLAALAFTPDPGTRRSKSSSAMVKPFARIIAFPAWQTARSKLGLPKPMQMLVSYRHQVRENTLPPMERTIRD